MNIKNLLISVLLYSCFATSVYAECNVTNEELYLAKTMFHEARSEGLDAMQLVGEVVLSRVESDHFPDTICEVIFQKNQFHSIHSFDKKIKEEEQKLFNASKVLAEDLIAGEIEYFDIGATYFVNTEELGYTPVWAKNFSVVGFYGEHTFYSNPKETMEEIYFVSDEKTSDERYF